MLLLNGAFDVTQSKILSKTQLSIVIYIGRESTESRQVALLHIITPATTPTFKLIKAEMGSKKMSQTWSIRRRKGKQISIRIGCFCKCRLGQRLVTCSKNTVFSVHPMHVDRSQYSILSLPFVSVEQMQWVCAFHAPHPAHSSHYYTLWSARETDIGLELL